MKIVILGAGASFDSINRFHDEYHEAHQWRPPLGNDIFGARQNFRDIYDKYPGAKAYSHAIGAGNDIEDFFQTKWELATEKNDKYILSNIINTQYCLQELFYEISIQYSQNIGSSNYHVLMHQAYDYHLLTGEEVVFITFNYDLLLEYALLELFNEGNSLTLETYTKYPIKIFKPHGSCNWFKKFSHNFIKFDLHSLLTLKPDLKTINDRLTDEIVVSEFPLLKPQSSELDYPIFCLSPELANSKNYVDCFPQLLIPIKSKDEFVMPKEHVDLMNNYLAQCTEMLIIGWKGQEEHFLTTLQEQCGDKEINATFVTCGDELPQKELNERIPKMRPNMFISKYFESHTERNKNVIDLTHNQGTFSSYILNVTKKGHPGFFNIEEKKA
jgi:hypothetical protein